MPSTSSGSRGRGSRGHHRRNRRARSHAAAHADPPSLTPAIEHPLVPSSEPELLMDDDAVADLCDHITREGRVAFDTEFIGETSYYPRLCLIQVATSSRLAILDPLSGIDVLPLWKTLTDPGVTTIVHAGGQDLEPVPRLTGAIPGRVFDTQIAAGMSGYPYPASLSHLLKQVAGVKISKGFTFTDWEERPLSDLQKGYAADDVRYLVLLHDRLEKALEESGHAQWAQEEFDSIAQATAAVFDPTSQCRRILKNRTMKARPRRVLEEIVQARNLAAEQDDLPPRTLLPDQVVLEMVRKAPASVDELQRIKGMPRPTAQRFGDTLLKAMEAGRGAELSGTDRLESRDEGPNERLRIDGLWAAVSAWCLGRGLSPQLVTNRTNVGQWFLQLRGGDEPQGSLSTGWRADLMAQSVLPLLKDGATMSLQWNDHRLHARLTGHGGASGEQGGPAS